MRCIELFIPQFTWYILSEFHPREQFYSILIKMDDLNGVDPDKSNSPKDESTKGESALAVVTTPDEESERANRCGCLNLGGDKAVKGCNINGIARSAINMSNIYLANSMIFLACEAGGGLNEAGTQCIDYGVRVYGNKPDTLITNISVAAGLVAAILMPFFGAIVDYTAHRKRVGIWSAAGLAIISGIQVGTNEVSLCTNVPMN